MFLLWVCSVSFGIGVLLELCVVMVNVVVDFLFVVMVSGLMDNREFFWFNVGVWMMIMFCLCCDRFFFIFLVVMFIDYVLLVFGVLVKW